MRRALVLGYGESGKAAELFLKRRDWEVVVADRLPGPGMYADQDVSALADVDLVVVSPGVPPTQFLYAEAVTRGLPVIGEVELGLRGMRQRAVGVTGTNGKTTVTLLATHALRKHGLEAMAVGNVGLPLTQAIDQASEKTIFVIELSSWQLETVATGALDAAVVLNITPDHLDRHLTMENYASAKSAIQVALKAQGALYLHADVAQEFGSHFSRPFLLYNQKFLEASHDEVNQLAAFALCRTFGMSEDAFFGAIQDFQKPPHRMELVRRCEGVVYVDDSKGTNVDAVVKAVQSVSGEVLLIAGGVDKQGGYERWLRNFPGRVKAVFGIGEAAAAIQSCLEPALPVRLCASLQEALVWASESATEGDTVLLSPGCASYDMFKNYKHRGMVFQELVHQLCDKKEGLL